MTNGTRMRRMQDDDLARYIFHNSRAGKQCEHCIVGVDEKRRCKNPEADCLDMIYEWLLTDETIK